MIQWVSLSSTVFKAFSEAYLCFLASALTKKKNGEVIKFLGILKKCLSKNKIYFC